MYLVTIYDWLDGSLFQNLDDASYKILCTRIGIFTVTDHNSFSLSHQIFVLK